jgi:hypothetical protein
MFRVITVSHSFHAPSEDSLTLGPIYIWESPVLGEPVLSSAAVDFLTWPILLSSLPLGPPGPC